MEYQRLKDEKNILERLGNFIKSVGFPVVAFLMMWYLCNNTIKENTKVLADLSSDVKTWKSGAR